MLLDHKNRITSPDMGLVGCVWPPREVADAVAMPFDLLARESRGRVC